MSIDYRIAYIFSLIFFSVFLSAQNRAESVDVTIRFKDIHISDALLKLSEAAHIPIGFDSKLFNKENKTITRNYQNVDLNTILKDILNGTGISFKYKNKNLILYPAKIKEVIISGYILDKSSKEKLIGATIFDRTSGRGVIANNYGFFSLKVPVGKHRISVSYIGYKSSDLSIDCKKDMFLEIGLELRNTMNEIIIYDNDSNTIISEKSVKNIYINDIDGIVSNGGEPDVIHYLQTVPGIQSNADGLGGLNVRGGNADQNIILLDDAQVFYPSHAFGIFSIFNPNAIRSIKFYKEGFKAKYGGRLSSVLDIRTKEGNTKHSSYTFSTSTIATNVAVETPIVKDKSSIFLAARRSHIDPLIDYFASKTKNENENSGSRRYYFYDINLKFHSAITPKDRIYISGYKGNDFYRDKTAYSDTTEYDFGLIENQNQKLIWGNSLVSLRWNHIFGNILFGNLTATHSQYGYQGYLDKFSLYSDVDSTFQDIYQSDFISKITDSNIKLDFNLYWNVHNRLNFGIGFLSRNFETKLFQNNKNLEYPNSQKLDRLRVSKAVFDPVTFFSKELNLYIEDRMIILKNLVFNIGFHNSFFNYRGFYHNSIQPRISFDWRLNKTTHCNFSFSKMTQNLHILTSSGGGLPTDIWVPSNQIIAPKNSFMYSARIEKKWKKYWTSIISMYYKKMNGLIQYYDEAKLPLITDNDSSFWEDEVSVGKGKSYGVEMELSYKSPKIFSSIQYTFMNSSRQFEGVNQGEKFVFIYDQPHNLRVDFSMNITPNSKFTLGWNWHTGIPYTKYKSSFKFNPLVNDYWFGAEAEDGSEGIASTINGARLPDYHSLNAKFDINWGKKYAQSFSIGVTNIYNRKNAYFSYEYVDLFDNENKTVNKTTFPILPSLRYQIKFGGK